MDALVSWIPRQLLVIALVAPTTRLQKTIAFGVIFVSQAWAYLSIIDRPGLRGWAAYGEASGLSGALLLTGMLLLAKDDASTSITWPRDFYSKSRTSSFGIAKSEKSQGATKARTFLADNSLNLSTRIWRAYSFTHDPRLIGTNNQAANIIPLSPSLSSSRTNFCLDRLYSLVISLFFVVAIAAAPKYSQFCLEAATKSPPPLLQRFVGTFGSLVFTWHLIRCGQCILAVTSVALGICEPGEWPDIFGAVEDAYTVRRAWGRSWHQMLRKPLESGGNAVVSFVGAKPHTFASKYLKLYTAFALSTFAHVWGDFLLRGNTLPPYLQSNKWARFSLDALFSPQFFMSQAVCIMVEDHIIDAIDWAWKSGKFGKVQTSQDAKATYPPSIAWYGKMVGYVWVFVWFCITIPLYQNRINFWAYTESLPETSLYN
ncbi:hypothetical protein DL93DRAFT_2227565 [Clavulina sp. PMI_390]|nr:hypothetical protein DL93DRAFT_2227565 [Clavulina sp. PMI_390]